MKETILNLVHGDCGDVLKDIRDNSIDLIVTSPPYTERRFDTYGGIKTSEYVEWFIPRSSEFLRVLKPTGTFILNIKEATENKEKELYVLHLILALKEQGWHWTEEFIWHKRNSFPGKWPNRFRDSWERLLQFNKTTDFAMYQDAVRVPIGDWADYRLKHLSKADKGRRESEVGSGFGRKVANWASRDTVYPTNVLHIATETSNRNHSAVFPKAIPEWFIKLFTKEGDWVLDPFAGSGTTLNVAGTLGRNAVGVEIMKEYFNISKKSLQKGSGKLTADGVHKVIKRTGKMVQKAPAKKRVVRKKTVRQAK